MDNDDRVVHWQKFASFCHFRHEMKSNKFRKDDGCASLISDRTLDRITDRHGKATAKVVAMQLEYLR